MERKQIGLTLATRMERSRCLEEFMIIIRFENQERVEHVLFLVVILLLR